jgi:hypothetical protein
MSDQSQLFDGFEVQAIYIDIPGLGKLPLAGVFGTTDVHGGDEFEAKVRFKVGLPSPDAKFDKEGNMASQLGIVYKAQPLLHGLEVTGYLRKDDVEAAWRSNHGATA